MRQKRHVFILLFVSLLILLFYSNISAQQNPENWPKRVLITNDNGIGDIKIVELARAFSQVAETYVVAPLEDKSGSTHYSTITRRGSIRVERRSLGEGIHAYAVDGFPADCVVIALAGIMQDNPPDLVISGINGGPNLGKDWLFSGTIGAARMASFAKIRAIAVSGLNARFPESVKAATQWVVRLAQSSVVRKLKPLQYITVSIPRIPPSQIKGVRVAQRAWFSQIPLFKKVSEEAEKNSEVWKLSGTRNLEVEQLSENDEALYKEGYIVVVPMQVDEHDYDLLSHLKKNLKIFPDWFSFKEGL